MPEDITSVDTNMSQSTQQFDDDEIVDHYGEPDDGVPLGIGGEKGKQSSPASTTLEADMLRDEPAPAQPKQPPEEKGEEIPPEGDAASGEPVAASENVPEEFPEALLRMAGFDTAEEARTAGFNDPATLLAGVQLAAKRFSVPQPRAVQPSPVPAVEPPKDEKPEPVDPEVFDEELVRVIQERDNYFTRRIAELESKLERDTRTNQELSRAAEFDKAVQELGGEWAAEFGSGGADTLFAKRDALSMAATQARLELYDATEVVRRANIEQGGQPMDLKQEIQWALMQKYPDKFKQQLLRERQAVAESRRGTQASRPTARKTPHGTKEERLLTALQQKYPSVDFSGGDDEHSGDI